MIKHIIGPVRAAAIVVATIALVITTSVTNSGATDNPFVARIDCVGGTSYIGEVTVTNPFNTAAKVVIEVGALKQTIENLAPGDYASREFDLGTTIGDIEGIITITEIGSYGGHDEFPIRWMVSECPAPTTSTTVPASPSTTVPVQICPDKGVCAPNIERPRPNEEPAPTVQDLVPPAQIGLTG